MIPKASRPRFAYLALALLGTLPPSAAGQAQPVPAAVSDEEKAGLQTIDAAIGLYEALIAKVPDVQQRTAGRALLDGFKDRRLALAGTFNRDLCGDLRWEINVECQRLVMWLAAPTVTIATTEAAPLRRTAVELFSPASDAETDTALAVADRSIRELADRTGRLPVGSTRDHAVRRLEKIRQLRETLRQKYTQAGWDALVVALQPEPSPPATSKLVNGPSPR